jgi:phosphoserine phosphatase
LRVLTRIQSFPAERLTGQEFISAVRALAPATAVFDCDGTLWGGDAGYGFMIWSMESGLVSRNASDWIDSRYRLYRAGEVSEAAMCGEMVQIYAGLREDEIRRAAVQYFAQHIESQIFPEMEELLGHLRVAGTEIWAVSSTNNWVIEAGVGRFGIGADRILSARVQVKAGVITSQLIDVPTDEGKARSLRAAGVTHPDAVFGNSVHDAAMLEMAKAPFAVNPTPALIEIAARHGWPVFYPAALLK